MLLARGSTDGNAYSSVNFQRYGSGRLPFFLLKAENASLLDQNGAFKCPPRGGNKWLKNRKRAQC